MEYIVRLSIELDFEHLSMDTFRLSYNPFKLFAIKLCEIDTYTKQTRLLIEYHKHKQFCEI